MTADASQPEEDELGELRGEIAAVRGMVENIIKPAQDSHDDRLTAVNGRVEELESRIVELEEQLDVIAGPGDGEKTPHKKRVFATRRMMANQARARSGRVAWTYGDVQDNLEANGHGRVHPQQAYRIIDDAGDHEAFGTGENRDGNAVVRCNADRLTADGGVHNVNNAGAVPATDGGTENGESTDESTT